jgi:hypothetical protein
MFILKLEKVGDIIFVENKFYFGYSISRNGIGLSILWCPRTTTFVNACTGISDK